MVKELKRQVIIGTAGHVDHGKSCLVKLLTGIDPDTLPEEKERSMTIDLGFVFMDTLGTESQIVFIDVPGHEGLVRTMVAGASNIDAVLLVIAADEGIMPQTEEHFNILNLLGVKKGIIALTKIDTVDSEQIEKVTNQVRLFTKGSFLQDAPIVGVSSVTGEGIDRIKDVLIELTHNVQERTDTGIFRMPIDRIFTVQGFGTVIAGTVLSGTVGIGDNIEIYPEGIISKVRGIQVHNQQVQKSVAGMRTALNVPDIKKEGLRRGQTAGAPGSLIPTNRIDAQLYILQNYKKTIKNRTRLRFHTGTEETICRLILLDRDSIAPGDSAPVQFFLESSLVGLPRDRFIVRTFSPITTIGGGVILDINPGRHKRFDSEHINTLKKLEGETAEIVEGIILKNRFLPLSIPEIVRQAGENEEKIESALKKLLDEKKLVVIGAGQKRYLHTTAYRELSERLLDTIRGFLRLNPYHLSMPFSHIQSSMYRITDKTTFDVLFTALEKKGVLFRQGGSVVLSGYSIKLKPKEQEYADKITGIFLEDGFSPPLEHDIQQRLGISPVNFNNIMKALLEQGILVRLSDKVVYHQEHLEKVKNVVVEYLKKSSGITIGELRDNLGISRKYAQAILEYFDGVGITKRLGDRHISGR